MYVDGMRVDRGVEGLRTDRVLRNRRQTAAKLSRCWCSITFTTTCCCCCCCREACSQTSTCMVFITIFIIDRKCFIIKNKKTYRHLHHHHRNLCNLVHVPVFFSYKKFTYFRCRKHIVMKSVSKFIMDWYDFILFFVFKILNKQFRNDLSQYRIKNWCTK